MTLKLKPIGRIAPTPQEWCVMSTNDQGYADGQLYWWPWTFINNLIVVGALAHERQRTEYRLGYEETRRMCL